MEIFFQKYIKGLINLPNINRPVPIFLNLILVFSVDSIMVYSVTLTKSVSPITGISYGIWPALAIERLPTLSTANLCVIHSKIKCVRLEVQR